MVTAGASTTYIFAKLDCPAQTKIRRAAFGLGQEFTGRALKEIRESRVESVMGRVKHQGCSSELDIPII
jgi:hypothetical protein